MTRTSPSFCAYTDGPCDQDFGKQSTTTAVLLYPSEPVPISSTIEAAAHKLRLVDKQSRLLTWREFRTAGQVIFCAICKSCRFTSTVVADVTTLNLNLMFEIGFALGLELPVLLIRDTSLMRDKRDFEELAVLDTIGYLDFRNSEELATRLAEHIPKAQPIPAPPAALQHEQPLYVIKSHLSTEGQVRILATIKQSSLRQRVYDPIEDPRLTLHDVRKHVAASYGVVGHLLLPDRSGSAVHNARTAFIAGVAAASGKSVLLLQEDAVSQPIDYRDIVAYYKHVDQIPGRLEQFIRQVIERLQDRNLPAAKAPHGLLESVDLGDVAAENEVRQLRAYFVQTGQYNTARRGHARLVVGRKGAGKTAMFYAIRDAVPRTHSQLVSDLKPEGYQFTKLREAILEHLSPGLQEHTLTAFWNYILLCEIAQRIMETDYSWAQRDSDRAARFQQLADAYEGHNPTNRGDLSERLLWQISKLADRFAQAGKPTQASTLTQALFKEDIPQLDERLAVYLAEKHVVWLLFDNLDKGWPTRGASSADILILRTLMDATRKLQRQLSKRDVETVSLVFLRNDIYEHLVRDTSDRDKDTAITLDWDDREVFKEIVRQRITATTSLDGTFEETWQAVFSNYVGTRDSFDFVLERTLMRPRDLLKFLHRAIEVAVNRKHQKVTQEDFIMAERAYSEDMLVSLGFELADVRPDFGNIPLVFMGCPTTPTEDEVRTILTPIADTDDIRQQVIELLLWFGFLGVQDTKSEDSQYAYEVRYNLAKLMSLLRSGHARFIIHPAFRSALGTSSQHPRLPDIP